MVTNLLTSPHISSHLLSTFTSQTFTLVFVLKMGGQLACDWGLSVYNEPPVKFQSVGFLIFGKLRRLTGHSLS